MRIFNLYEDDWDRSEEREGWRSKDAWVGARGSVPSSSVGDVVCFLRGKDGAHQVSDRTDSPIRVLMLSTLVAPDLVEYLDSGRIGARSVAGERILLSRPGPMLDYWDGED